jgi:hypothetical protein
VILLLAQQMMALTEAARQGAEMIGFLGAVARYDFDDIQIIAGPKQIRKGRSVLSNNNIGRAEQGHLKRERLSFQSAGHQIQILRY